MSIVNADDFGMSSSVNEAISKCFAQGLIHRTTIMVNMPAFVEGCIMAEKEKFKDKVGLHLVLDEGVPLTKQIKANPHICRDGLFIKGWCTGIKRKLYLNCEDRRCINEEIEAQMKAYCNAGFTLMHLDSHHLFHSSSPMMIEIVSDLALKYGFKSMRNVATYNKDNLIYKLVKSYVSFKINRHFQTTSNFTSYSQYPMAIEDVEYMSHPDMVDGVVVDYENRTTKQYRKFER